MKTLILFLEFTACVTAAATTTGHTTATAETNGHSKTEPETPKNILPKFTPKPAIYKIDNYAYQLKNPIDCYGTNLDTYDSFNSTDNGYSPD